MPVPLPDTINLSPETLVVTINTIIKDVKKKLEIVKNSIMDTIVFVVPDTLPETGAN